MQFRSDVTVELIDGTASDALVARAARVSTGNDMSSDNESGLINFLMKNRHGSPFEHGIFTFRVEAPIFVWREHMRHRIASYNEESGRYKKLEPVFYVPDEDRNLVQEGKAGQYSFVPGSSNQQALVRVEIEANSEDAYKSYQNMLNNGIAREVARMVLPVNIYSSAYVSMNPRGLMNFISLRTKSDDSFFPSFPQREIEMVAEKYEQIFSQEMPLTYIAFTNNGRVCP